MFTVPSTFPLSCVDTVWRVPFQTGAPLPEIAADCMETLTRNAATYLRLDPAYGPWRRATANLEAAKAKVDALEQRRKDLQAARQVEADVEKEDFLNRNLAAERECAQELEIAVQTLEAVKEIHARRENTVHKELKKIAQKVVAEYRAAHELHAQDLCRRLSDAAGDLVAQLVETHRKIGYTSTDVHVLHGSVTNLVLKQA